MSFAESQVASVAENQSKIKQKRKVQEKSSRSSSKSSIDQQTELKPKEIEINDLKSQEIVKSQIDENDLFIQDMPRENLFKKMLYYSEVKRKERDSMSANKIREMDLMS